MNLVCSANHQSRSVGDLSKTCRVADCEAPVWSRGLCQFHDQRRRKGRDLTAPPRPKCVVAGKRLECSVPGCGRGRIAQGMCEAHYARNKRGVSLTSPLRASQKKQRTRRCAIPGCASPHYAQDLCCKHYARRKRHGDPLKTLTGLGYINEQGYRIVNGRPEHRAVMEAQIGRPLRAEESVHHRNGVRDDNRPENLELWSKSQPAGQRVEDKVAWAIELLRLYRPEALR